VGASGAEEDELSLQPLPRHSHSPSCDLVFPFGRHASFSHGPNLLRTCSTAPSESSIILPTRTRRHGCTPTPRLRDDAYHWTVRTTFCFHLLPGTQFARAPEQYTSLYTSQASLSRHHGNTTVSDRRHCNRQLKSPQPKQQPQQQQQASLCLSSISSDSTASFGPPFVRV